MAVVWARLKRSRTFESKANSLAGQRIYLVLCDNKTTDTPDVAVAAVPSANTSWSGSLAGLKVSGHDARELDEVPADGGTFYEVTVDYGTKTLDPAQQNPDPRERPPIVRLTFDSSDEEVSKSQGAPLIENGEGEVIEGADAWRWGKSICNSAGDKFDPSIVDTFRDPVITVTKNVGSFPWEAAQTAVDAINSDDFTIYYRGQSYTVPEQTAWIYDLATEPGYENGIEFETVTLVIKCRKDGWFVRVEDRGFQELKNGDRPTRPILDANGEPVLSPVLLDGSGAVKPPAETDPVWLKFRRKRLYDFSTLPYFGTAPEEP